ncbi:hypothetical protein Q3V94_02095 [Caloramator sp. CAR-1]|uniref:hypothetical protein n=1 Tax=Caloramator sp. CAR-1 TaxID=3062777 RepID=UPI0026E19E64|nr:hypothetical protein [Caloramator sp. CAR-1]MDO6353877.1 hypothetical protein [Caloramator sp. CAR-1]
MVALSHITFISLNSSPAKMGAFQYKGDALLQKTYTVDFLTKKEQLTTVSSNVLCRRKPPCNY